MKKIIINEIFRGDRVLWLITLFFMLLGIIFSFSALENAAYAKGRSPIESLCIYSIGSSVLIVVSLIDYRKIIKYLFFVYPISLVLLLLIVGMRETFDYSLRWISIGSFVIQPIQLTVVSSVVFLLFLINHFLESYFLRSFVRLFIFFSLTIGPALVLLSFTDLPSAILLLFICLTIFYVCSVKSRYFMYIMLIYLSLFFIVAIIYVAIKVNVDFTSLRTVYEGLIEGFKDILDNNSSTPIYEMAFEKGGILGVGIGQCSSNIAYYDYAFAVLIEELGILGGTFVLLLYICFLARLVIIVNKCRNYSEAITVVGLGLIIVFQSFLHIAVSLGLIPLNGFDLPFISLVRQFVIVNCIIVGVIINISSQVSDEINSNCKENSVIPHNSLFKR